MALKDTDTSAEYPYMFLISQGMCQQVFTNTADAPIYTLSMVWTYYSVDANGDVTFDPNGQVTYYDENFYATAIAKAAVGDNTDVNSLGTQVASLKAIVLSATGRILEDA